MFSYYLSTNNSSIQFYAFAMQSFTLSSCDTGDDHLLTLQYIKGDVCFRMVSEFRLCNASLCECMNFHFTLGAPFFLLLFT